MDEKYLTVTALTKYLKYKFDSDQNLQRVFLRGEISNFKAHSSGHYYFSIKDENSKINAIMFSTYTKKLPFVPTEGMKIMVSGSIRIYETTGNYQIYINDLIEDGVGNLHIAFEKLKKKLTSEGLFDKKYKKGIPKYPSKIGIVTAATGAAVKDILSTIKRRYPVCQTYLFPCLVQGEQASLDIIKKIKQAENYDLDVLIVGRGGGSFEDLNSFNDEQLARTIFACSIPLISAVGHEIDYTIADFVADLRAPTPTGAAEMAVPNITELSQMLHQYHIRLNEVILKKINYLKLYMEGIKSSFVIKNPMLMFDNKKQRLDLIEEKLNHVLKNKIETEKKRFNYLKNNFILNNPNVLYQNQKVVFSNLIEKLELVSPMNTLKRGYTLTYQENQIVKSIKKINKNDLLKIKFYDGNVTVQVLDKEKKDGKNRNEI